MGGSKKVDFQIKHTLMHSPVKLRANRMWFDVVIDGCKSL
jgi:hypothetical protein